MYHHIHLRLHASPCFLSIHADQKHLVIVGHGVSQGCLHGYADSLSDRCAFPILLDDLADEKCDYEIRATGMLPANVLLDGFWFEFRHLTIQTRKGPPKRAEAQRVAAIAFALK